MSSVSTRGRPDRAAASPAVLRRIRARCWAPSVRCTGTPPIDAARQRGRPRARLPNKQTWASKPATLNGRAVQPDAAPRADRPLHARKPVADAQGTVHSASTAARMTADRFARGSGSRRRRRRSRDRPTRPRAPSATVAHPSPHSKSLGCYERLCDADASRDGRRPLNDRRVPADGLLEAGMNDGGMFPLVALGHAPAARGQPAALPRAAG